MNWYLAVLNKYAVFEGRARRKEYWMFLLINILIMLAIAAVLGGIGAAINVPELAFGYVLYALAVLIPSIAVVVRRLHDIGKSGWWYFVSLVPFVGGIWLIILLATEGDAGDNIYGPDPKQEGAIPDSSVLDGGMTS